MRWPDSVERKFLGFSFSNKKEPKRRIPPKALLRCKQKIRELTRPTRGISLEQMTKELAAYLLSDTLTAAGLGRMDPTQDAIDDLETVETWARAVPEITPTRVSITLIANTIRSCHGPWRLAHSPALSIALPIAYFDSIGLPWLFGGPA